MLVSLAQLIALGASLELGEVCIPQCYRCLRTSSVVNPRLVCLARPSNRVCGVAAGACEREERPNQH